MRSWCCEGQVEEIRSVRGQGPMCSRGLSVGDPSCHCMKKPEDYHGPYWYLLQEERKTRSKYIGKQLPVETS